MILTATTFPPFLFEIAMVTSSKNNVLGIPLRIALRHMRTSVNWAVFNKNIPDSLIIEINFNIALKGKIL